MYEGCIASNIGSNSNTVDRGKCLEQGGKSKNSPSVKSKPLESLWASEKGMESRSTYHRVGSRRSISFDGKDVG